MNSTDLQVVRQGGVVWLPSVLYKLPTPLRYRIECAAGAAFPNLMFGQVLLEAAPRSSTATAQSGIIGGAPMRSSLGSPS
jgi:hypothetical protein